MRKEIRNLLKALGARCYDEKKKRQSSLALSFSMAVLTMI